MSNTELVTPVELHRSLELMTFFSELSKTQTNPAIVKESAAWQADQQWLELRHAIGIEAALSFLEMVCHDQTWLAPSFTQSGEMILGKQQPSFVESLIETVARLQFLTEWAAHQPSSIDAIISGGSMSYGRFFNVRGGYPQSSDLDILLVVNDSFSADHAAKMLPESLGFTTEQVELYSRRIDHFQSLHKDNKATVLSQKFEVPQIGFDVSTHLFTLTDFETYTLAQVAASLKQRTDTEMTIKDYKPAAFKHRVLTQRTLTGKPYPFSIHEEQLPTGETVTTLLNHAVIDTSVVPGIYQNVISPMFEVELDRTGEVTAIVHQFEKVMRHQAHAASEQDSTASLAKSHTRYPLFSRRIISHIDRDTA